MGLKKLLIVGCDGKDCQNEVTIKVVSTRNTVEKEHLPKRWRIELRGDFPGYWFVYFCPLHKDEK